MPQPICAVLFDMDGLMFDTERLSDRIWHALGPRYGIEIGPDEMALLRGRSYQAGKEAFLQRFGTEFPYDQLARDAHAELRRRLDVQVPKRPGLEELLAFLQGRRVPMAVASSTNREQVERNLTASGVRGFFSAVLCGDMVARSKPEPDIYLAAAAALAVPAGRCLVLEDSHNGVRAGAAAGCETIMIPDTSPVTPEMRSLAAAVLPTLADVIPYLKGRLLPTA